MTTQEHKMELVEEPQKFAVACRNTSCQMPPEELANKTRSHFLDGETGKTYCEQCGTILRYHRKKWMSRGEDMPLTLEEVIARHSS